MNAISYSKITKSFTDMMVRVCEDHEPLIVTHQKSPPVVMLSLEDYNAMEETMHLLSNPSNAMHLRESISEFENGNYYIKELMN
jgi:antitoxin YefM